MFCFFCFSGTYKFVRRIRKRKIVLTVSYYNTDRILPSSKYGKISKLLSSTSVYTTSARYSGIGATVRSLNSPRMSVSGEKPMTCSNIMSVRRV